MAKPTSTNPSGTKPPTLASNEQAIRDEADRNQQHADAATAAVHVSHVNTPDPNAPLDEHLDESARSAIKLFNDRVITVLEVFEDYRAKAQAGNLTADDEKRTGAALEYLRELIETHKPMPPLPQILVK